MMQENAAESEAATWLALLKFFEIADDFSLPVAFDSGIDVGDFWGHALREELFPIRITDLRPGFRINFR